MHIELKVPLDVITPLGKAKAIALVNYNEQDAEWITFIKSTGECWYWQNQYIRLAPLPSNTIRGVSEFNDVSKEIQIHIERYKKNGWL